MTPLESLIAWVVILVASILGLMTREQRGWRLFAITLAVAIVMLLVAVARR